MRFALPGVVLWGLLGEKVGELGENELFFFSFLLSPVLSESSSIPRSGRRHIPKFRY